MLGECNWQKVVTVVLRIGFWTVCRGILQCSSLASNEVEQLPSAHHVKSHVHTIQSLGGLDHFLKI